MTTTEEELRAENKELLKQIQQLNEQIAFLTKHIFGRSSEKMINPNQMSLLDDDGVFTVPEQTGKQSEDSKESEIKNDHLTRKPKRTRQDALATDLPVEEEIIERANTHCEHGHELVCVGKHFVRDEVCEVPARLFIKRIFEQTYKCKTCEQINGLSHLYQAQAPRAILAHSLASSSVLAEILLQKFGMGMPIYRQLQQFKRAGLVVSETTLANWIIKAAEIIMPLYNLLKQHLVCQHYLQGDETPYQVLQEPGREATSKSYIWVARSITRSTQPVVFYSYANTRSGKFAQSLYSNFTGVLQCDGYSGYNLLEDSIVRVGCWAHVRRKFYDDANKVKHHFQSTRGLDLINQMFTLEQRWKDLSAEKRYLKRQQELKPVIEAFWKWCDGADALPKSLLGKALSYAQGQRAALNQVLAYGEVDLSNNASERNMKSYVIGRKNWLFSTSPQGAKANAVWVSIVETAKANDLDPRAYIQYLLETVSQLPDFSRKEDLEACLPWNRQVRIEPAETA